MYAGVLYVVVADGDEGPDGHQLEVDGEGEGHIPGHQ